jgi:hypothetical protein
MTDLDVSIFDAWRCFEDSPDAGDPACVCSWCEQPIAEHDTPIRVFVEDGRVGEYRFHYPCFIASIDDASPHHA